jgi:hypothetical protein
VTDYTSVLERAGSNAPPSDLQLERVLHRRDRKRRNQRITAGVVGIAVFVAAIWIVTSVGSLDRSQTSVVPGGDVTGPAETGRTALEPVVPPPGIPPHGATPSFPETGKLILSVSLFSFNVPPAPEELTHMYVYADGRLIWSRDSDLLESTDAYNTGLVEERLTPEGAELMRSEVISSGLIDPDPDSGVMVDGEADPDTFPFVGFIAVRDADRLFGREFASAGYETGGPHNEGETTCNPGWGCAHIATAEEERRLQSLYARLTDPASWLPASAWADQEIRAYVPSRYQVCYGGTTETIERDRLLHAIPRPVQELLEARDAENERFNGYLSFGEWLDGVRVTGYCSELTTEEARDVVRGLDDAGFEREQLLTYANGPHATFEYIFSVPDPAGTAALWLDPYLPHWDAICIPCT